MNPLFRVALHLRSYVQVRPTGTLDLANLLTVVAVDPIFEIRRASGAQISVATESAGLQLVNELGAPDAGRWDQV